MIVTLFRNLLLSFSKRNIFLNHKTISNVMFYVNVGNAIEIEMKQISKYFRFKLFSRPKLKKHVFLDSVFPNKY